MLEVYKPLAARHSRAGCKDWKLNPTLLHSLKFLSCYIQSLTFILLNTIFLKHFPETTAVHLRHKLYIILPKVFLFDLFDAQWFEYCWFEGLRVSIPITLLMLWSTAESMKDFKGMRPERHGTIPDCPFLPGSFFHGARPPAVTQPQIPAHPGAISCLSMMNHTTWKVWRGSKWTGTVCLNIPA